MRENFPLAVAATLIMLSFGIVVLFVAAGIIENETSGEIELQHIESLFENATEIAKDTQNSTKYELRQLFNKTSDALRNNPDIIKFQQQWVSQTNSSGDD